MKIEVMGPGCPRCRTTEENVREAVAQLGTEAEVEHIYDMNEYSKRGVMLTPAVVVDGEVKVSGRVPSVEELKSLLAGS
jgi:small redox-active disulfide protein 2